MLLYMPAAVSLYDTVRSYSIGFCTLMLLMKARNSIAKYRAPAPGGGKASNMRDQCHSYRLTVLFYCFKGVCKLTCERFVSRGTSLDDRLVESLCHLVHLCRSLAASGDSIELGF